MHDTVRSIIYSNIKKIKPSITFENLSDDSLLFGSSSELDSLDLINLIVGIEQDLLSQLNIEITLASDEALSQEVSPFTSVNTLINYINKITKS
jgi:acyl carrier protein